IRSAWRRRMRPRHLPHRNRTRQRRRFARCATRAAGTRMGRERRTRSTEGGGMSAARPLRRRSALQAAASRDATLPRSVHARATGLRARIGLQCRIFDPATDPDGAEPLLAEVIGFAGAEVILAPYGALQGVAVGAAVQALADEAQVPCGPALLGRVIDAFGRPL